MNFKKKLVNLFFRVILRFVRLTKRKELTVSANKSNSKVAAEIITTAPVVTPKFTRFMVGTYVEPTNGELMLAYVQFDPITKVVGEVKTERVAGDTEVMKERLVIKQAQLGVFSPHEVSSGAKLEEMY